MSKLQDLLPLPANKFKYFTELILGEGWGEGPRKFPISPLNLIMTNKKRFIFFTLLIFTLGQIATDLYIPSLTYIANYFGTNTHMVQLSITTYVLSAAFSQPFYGIVSDGYGRKPVLFIGTMVAIIGTIMCIYAHTIISFLAGRFVQGLGAGVGTTVCRAMMRDLFKGHELILTNSHLAVANISLLIIAPVMGGYLSHYINWQACFVLLLIIASVNLISILFILPETSTNHSKRNLHPKRVIRNIKSLLFSRNFQIYSFCGFLTFGGVIAWATAGPILLNHYYHVSAVHIGWIYFIVGLSYILGNIFNRQSVYRVGLNKMIRIGFTIQLINGLILMLVFYLQIPNIIAVVIPVCFYMFAASLIAPNASVGAINDFTKIAGTASAVLSTIQSMGAIFFSFIIALNHSQDLILIASCFVGIGGIALVVDYFFNPHDDEEFRSKFFDSDETIK